MEYFFWFFIDRTGEKKVDKKGFEEKKVGGEDGGGKKNSNLENV